MTKDRGEVKIRYSLKQGKEEALRNDNVQVLPVSRWKIFLVIVPAFIAAAFLSAFFFSIFFPLFIFCGVILGLWIWWVRRKMLKSKRAENLEGEYVVIKETHIVKTKTDSEEAQ